MERRRLWECLREGRNGAIEVVSNPRESVEGEGEDDEDEDKEDVGEELEVEGVYDSRMSLPVPGRVRLQARVSIALMRELARDAGCGDAGEANCVFSEVSIPVRVSSGRYDEESGC